MKRISLRRVALYLLIIAGGGIIFSCNRKGDCCSSIDTLFTIKVLNKDGQSLLNPATPGAFSVQGIALRTLKNGVEVQRYNNDVTAPVLRVNSLQTNGEDYTISILPSLFSDFQTNVTTLIKWNAGDADTILYQLSKTGGNITLEKIWFNGQIKFDILSNPQVVDRSGPFRFFQVVK